MATWVAALLKGWVYYRITN